VCREPFGRVERSLSGIRHTLVVRSIRNLGAAEKGMGRVGVAVAVVAVGAAAQIGSAATARAEAHAVHGSVLAYEAPDGIHLVRADGTDDRRVASSRPGDGEPAWSPDGRRLVVIAAKRGSAGRLVVLDLAARRRVSLTAARSSAESPTWSSDGSTIVFDSARYQYWELFSIRPDGTHLKPLNEGYYPAFGPDGAYLAYDSDGGTTPSQDWIFILENGDSTPVVYEDSWGAAWWPNGIEIAFMTEDSASGSEDSRVEIHRIGIDGLHERRLTHNRVWDGDPSVSPDGAQIAFDTGRFGWDEIELMNADGTHQRRLTHELHGNACCPAWQPRSRR
jgi:TolB protein